MPLQLLYNVLMSLTSLWTLWYWTAVQSNITTGKWNRKPPPSSQDSVDVPGSHYCKPSEPPRGSSVDPFLLVFYTRLWESCNLKILCCKYADLAVIFSWSARSSLPRCLPTLMGEQLLAAVYRPAQFLTPIQKKKKRMEVFYMLPQIILHQ